MRRVVVTGLGMVTPLGVGVDHNWSQILAGKSGIGRITNFEVDDIACQIAGQVPGPDVEGGLNLDDFIDPREQRRQDRFIQFGNVAAQLAVEDSGWMPEDRESQNRTGVMIGSGIGGLDTIVQTDQLMNARGTRKISPFFIPSSLINLVSGHVSIKYGFRGPNHAVVTACSTGAHAIGDAARMVALDDADVMVAGGAEAAVCRIGMAGFAAARALSTSFNDDPQKGSRPWDKGRDGFVMGEGAGIVVLEELEHARARGAKIYAEVKGYGMSGDAYHITAPAEDGDGGFRAMQAALKRAGIAAEEIDYVNAHGTSTPLGDLIEAGAVRRLLGDAVGNVSMSSTKSATGHLLGAAGAIEAIYSIKTIETGNLPPTLNLEDPEDAVADFDLVPLKSRKREVRNAMSNSFGFGGTNASLIIGRVD